MKRIFCGALFVFCMDALAVEPLPVKDFMRHAEYSSVEISPDGKYLAVSAPMGERDILVVLQTSDLKPVKVNQLPDGKSVGEYFWIGPDRLMFTATRKFGQFAAPFGTGEWYAVNADGSRPRVLVTYEGTTVDGAKKFDERYRPLAALPTNSSKVLVQLSYSQGSESGDRADVLEMNTFTGRTKRIGRAPKPGCSFVLDASDRPAYVNCFDNSQRDYNTEQHLQAYHWADEQWSLVHDSRKTGNRLRVTHVDPDGTAYAVMHDNKAPNQLGTLDPRSGAFNTLDRDPRVDLAASVLSADGDTLLGVVRMPGKPDVRLLNDAHPDAQLIARLRASFPTESIRVTSATADARQLVIEVSSDRNPGDFYLFDREEGKARYLLSTRKWIDSKKMAEMRPFTFTARDGTKVSGYLTLPPGKPLAGLPMIVNPHGGPHGIRDFWGFNQETQLFANRGYLVLQVDFRGSGGYGRAFETMGYGQWGASMQDDVTDATRWAIEQGFADEDRICIYGASYGAYAALMGAVREPDLYRCAIGYVGVYDLALMYKEGDIPQSDTGGNYLESVIGKDRSLLASRSPAARAAEIKVPVFLAAGGRDQRTPKEQTDSMADALERAGNPVRVNVFEPKEGHGFYDVVARENVYTRMLAFFGEHIGSPVSVGTITKDAGADGN